MSAEIIPFLDLTEKEAAFVEARLLGMSPYQAAKHVGYANPKSNGHIVNQKEHIQRALQYGFAEARKEFHYDREKLVQRLEEAIDIARLQGEPGTMVNALREIARVFGLYEPEKKELTITNENPTISQLQNASIEELLRLTGREDTLISDVEYEVVDVAEDPSKDV